MKKFTTIFGILLLTFQLNVLAQTQIGQTLIGDVEGDYFCTNDINSDGTRVVAGGPINGNTYVKVYEFDGADWNQLGSTIEGEQVYERFGWQVAMNGDGNIIAAVGPGNDANGNNSGYVQVYEYDGSDWVQLGTNIYGEADFDMGAFGGIDLSSDGMRVAVGAPYNDGNGEDAGHVRVFEYDGSDWLKVGNDLDGPAAFSFTGNRVSLNNDGSRVTVGSADVDTANGFQTGQLGVYEYDGSDWVQMGGDILGEEDFDRFGNDAALNAEGKIVVVGAEGNNGNGGNDIGSARVFKYDGSDWVQMGTDIDGDQDGALGWEVSINGDGTIISLGTDLYDGNGVDSGLTRVYKFDGTDWIKRGVDIEGNNALVSEGWLTSLSEDGSVLATGAYGYSGFKGSVRVFDLSDIIIIYALDGTTSASIPSLYCGNTEVEPTITLTNVGSDNITSASIDWNLDGGSNTTINFNGSLAINESETFTIGPLTLAVGVHEINAFLTSVNGGTDENTNNDNASSSIEIVNYNTSQVHLELLTDDWAEETSWEYRSSNGTVLYSFGPYQQTTDDNTIFNYSFDVDENECYYFEVFDQFGDGICCDFGVGNYSLKTDDNTVIVSGGEFGFSEVTDIVIDENLGINDILAQNLVMYPNPTSNLLNIELIDGNGDFGYSIVNILGQVVKIGTLNNGINTITLGTLNTGLYFVKVQDNTTNKSVVNKLIIE